MAKKKSDKHQPDTQIQASRAGARPEAGDTPPAKMKRKEYERE
jgi:hypothetical protein